MGKIFLITALLTLSLFAITPVFAQEKDVFNSSGLPMPRFVSLRSDKVFVRTGPALRYPIKWVFQRKNLPVEVIQEFDTWRKIRDYEGQEGWIHQSLTQGRRFALVDTGKDMLTLMRKADEASKPVALLEPEVIVKLEECLETFCHVSVDGFKGWAERKLLYGIYENEKLD
ncbi:MAG: SH3 domain-containing protein [Pseudomonadota bacterium]